MGDGQDSLTPDDASQGSDPAGYNPASGSRPGPDTNPGVSDHIAAFVSAMRNWAADSVGLVMLDAQLAWVSLVRMLLFGVVAGVLLVGAWFGIMLALAFGLNRFGVPIEFILIGVSILSALVGIYLVRQIAALGENITFRTSRQHLRSNADEAPDKHLR